MTEKAATGAARLSGALEGMRILDFTLIVLGPLATRMLGDHGALFTGTVAKPSAPAGRGVAVEQTAATPGARKAAHV